MRLLILVCPLLFAFCGSSVPQRAYKGKVQIVEHFEDYKVRMVDHFEDMRVSYVRRTPVRIGEWEIVDHDADFKIRLVEHGEDFTIRLVDHNCGLTVH